MFIVRSLKLCDRLLGDKEAADLSAALRSGEVLDIALLDRFAIDKLDNELSAILSHYRCSEGRWYRQILVNENGGVFSWGNDVTSNAAPVDLTDYPSLGSILNNLMRITKRLAPNDECRLFSAVPFLNKTWAYPRFYHRESHQTLNDILMERDTPEIYRLTCDIGLRNSCEVINVNLVPRWAMLDPDGAIRPEYRHLFQRQYIDYWNGQGPDDVQKQIDENMLPFPETKRDLLPGCGLAWLDNLFFHTPYLREGRLALELLDYPRSVLVVNEFANESYRTIPWDAETLLQLRRIVRI